ncbi:type II secretion system minor pseudopilin GspJ [Kaarinaea lacus]
MAIRRVQKNTDGFTLLELLISIAIFGLVAAMAYSGLNNVLIAREQTSAKADALHKLQLTFILLQRDIEQAVNRKILNELGESKGALVGNEIGEYLLEFTRTGWLNPLNVSRSHLQRVAYTINEEKLIRSQWYVLDRAQDSERYDAVLLEGVKKLEFRYLDDKKEWQRSWPPTSTLTSSNSEQPPAQTPPRAVAVELEVVGFGKLERWFRIPG